MFILFYCQQNDQFHLHSTNWRLPEQKKKHFKKKMHSNFPLHWFSS